MGRQLTFHFPDVVVVVVVAISGRKHRKRGRNDSNNNSNSSNDPRNLQDEIEDRSVDRHHISFTIEEEEEEFDSGLYLRIRRKKYLVKHKICHFFSLSLNSSR